MKSECSPKNRKLNNISLDIKSWKKDSIKISNSKKRDFQRSRINFKCFKNQPGRHKSKKMLLCKKLK